MPNANSFPDGQRGRVRAQDLGRVADYSASTLPARGPGLVGRRFPQGTTFSPLPTRRASSSKSTPTPFQLLQGYLDGDGVFQATPGENVFTFYQDSFFRADATSAQSTDIGNLTTALALSDGDSVWLQLDAADDGGSLQEASIVSGQTAPYESDGKLITFGGSGTDDDPYVWDQSFTPLAQVFAADASGQPVRGGLVYTVDAPANAQTPPTRIEVVQQTSTHLALALVLSAGRVGGMAFPDAAPLLS